VERDYWNAVTERLAKTLLQALLGGVLAALTALVAALMQSGTASAWDVDWWQVLGTTLYAAILSFVTSLLSTRFGASRGPSLAGEVLRAEPRHARRDDEPPSPLTRPRDPGPPHGAHDPDAEPGGPPR
jgi:Putative lactococcus lactis phage r1t holin